jgi:Sulfotransferase domain
MQSRPRGRKKVYIHVENGLCNRLRAYVSAKLLATKADRDLVLIWIPDLHCEARFSDLLIESEEIIESRSELADLDISPMSAYNYMEHLGGVKEQPIDPGAPGDLYIRSAYSLRSRILTIAEENDVLRGLRFASEIHRLTEHFDVSEAIGVHVRRGGGAGFDHAPWDRREHMSAKGKRLMDQYRSRTHPVAFMDRIDDVLSQDPEQRFFLAADSQETYRAFLNRYGEQTILHLPRDRYDRSKQQQVYAMADLLLLSQTKQLLGSSWSAFSEIAARLGGQNIELVGRAPDPEPASDAATATASVLRSAEPEGGRTVDRSNAPADIPIVVIGHRRPASLKRLFASLHRAILPRDVPLVISIDGGRGRDHDEVLKVVHDFQWPHGDKQILLQERNLGLREHVLRCGDLSQMHDGVLVLEDDLLVSPHFYSYGVEASRFYQGDDSIAGISLYSHRYNETAAAPFIPILDRSDVFFMQVAASWGQIWLDSQWREFREWLAAGSRGADPAALPPDVASWPVTSWKKLYVSYLVATGRFIVYPRMSLTTNFADAGVHVRKDTNLFQVPLQYEERTYNFIERNHSNAQYDAFCEMLPTCLTRLAPELEQYDYLVDLYATKRWTETGATRFILTSRPCDRWHHAFGRRLSPHETNVIEGIEGREIFLTSINGENARRNPGDVSKPTRTDRRKASDRGDAGTEPVPVLPPQPSMYDRFYVWAKTRNPLMFSAGRLVMWCGRKFRRYPGWVGAYLALVASLIGAGVLVGTPVGVLLWAAAGLLAAAAVTVGATGYAAFLVKESDQRSWQQHDSLRRRVDAATSSLRSEQKDAMRSSTEAMEGKVEDKIAALRVEQQTIKEEIEAGVRALDSVRQQHDTWSRRVDAAMVALRSEHQAAMQESTKPIEGKVEDRIAELRAEQQAIKEEVVAGIEKLRSEQKHAMRSSTEAMEGKVEDKIAALRVEQQAIKEEVVAGIEKLRSEQKHAMRSSTEAMEGKVEDKIAALRAEQQAIKEEVEAGIGELEAEVAVLDSEVSANDPRRRGHAARRVLRLSTGSKLSVLPNDVFLASYPRSGSTWLRFLVSNLRNWDEPTSFDSVDRRIPDVYVVPDHELTRRPQPRIMKIHEQFHPLYSRVIYIVRDPRDVAPSYLRYLRAQGHIPAETSLEVFLPEFVEGRVLFGAWKDHVSGWLEGRKEDSDFLLIRYEDIRKDTRAVLKRIADFIDLPVVERMVDRAIRLSSRDHMRALEEEYIKRGGTNANFIGTDGEDIDVPMALLEDRWGDVMKELGYL